jgi:hypothetical protein
VIRILIVAAACGGAAATFLPWEVYGSQTYDGWASGGWLSFGAFLVAAACALYRPLWAVRVLLVIAGMVAITAAAAKVGHVGAIKKSLTLSLDPSSRREGELVNIGVGAWITIASSITMIFGGLLWRRPKPGYLRPPELPRATVRAEPVAVRRAESQAKSLARLVSLRTCAPSRFSSSPAQLTPSRRKCSSVGRVKTARPCSKAALPR